MFYVDILKCSHVSLILPLILASSSSAASSVANLGSPKPEKRPANSPLPPPPANLASPEGGCSLEDMYAKVLIF